MENLKLELKEGDIQEKGGKRTRLKKIWIILEKIEKPRSGEQTGAIERNLAPPVRGRSTMGEFCYIKERQPTKSCH